jgi:hypothetical protein
MNDQSWKQREGNEPCQGLALKETIVILLVIRGP